MPVVTARITKDGATADQKRAIVADITATLQRVLGEKPEHTQSSSRRSTRRNGGSLGRSPPSTVASRRDRPPEAEHLVAAPLELVAPPLPRTPPGPRPPRRWRRGAGTGGRRGSGAGTPGPRRHPQQFGDCRPVESLVEPAAVEEQQVGHQGEVERRVGEREFRECADMLCRNPTGRQGA